MSSTNGRRCACAQRRCTRITRPHFSVLRARLSEVGFTLYAPYLSFSSFLHGTRYVVYGEQSCMLPLCPLTNCMHFSLT